MREKLTATFLVVLMVASMPGAMMIGGASQGTMTADVGDATIELTDLTVVDGQFYADQSDETTIEVTFNDPNDNSLEDLEEVKFEVYHSDVAADVEDDGTSVDADAREVYRFTYNVSEGTVTADEDHSSANISPEWNVSEPGTFESLNAEETLTIEFEAAKITKPATGEDEWIVSTQGVEDNGDRTEEVQQGGIDVHEFAGAVLEETTIDAGENLELGEVTKFSPNPVVTNEGNVDITIVPQSDGLENTATDSNDEITELYFNHEDLDNVNVTGNATPYNNIGDDTGTEFGEVVQNPYDADESAIVHSWLVVPEDADDGSYEGDFVMYGKAA